MNSIIKTILILFFLVSCGWSQFHYSHKEFIKDSQVTKRESIKIRSTKAIKNYKDIPAILDSNLNKAEDMKDKYQMKLKNLIKESPNDWTTKDVSIVNKQLKLCIKQATGLDSNYRKLMDLLAKSKKKPQGYQLWKLTEQLPINGLMTFKSSLIDLGSKFKMVFPKNW